MPAFTPAYWRELLPHIPLWHALTLPQRQAALALPQTYEAPAHAFRGLDPALSARLFETDARGRARPAEPLRRLTAALHRFSDWSPKDRIDVVRYVQSATTLAQRYAMTGLRPGSPAELAAYALAERISAGAFGRALAQSPNLREFLRAVGGWVPDGARFGEREYGLLRAWLESATAKGDAIYILAGDAFEGGADGLPAAELLHLAVGYGLALPFRAGDTLLPCFKAFAPAPVLGQGPERIEYAPAAEPRGPAFSRPFLLDDMETMLRSLRAAPAPVLSDGWGIPAAHLRKIAKGFIVLPESMPAALRDPEERARAAFWMILKQDLALPDGDRRKDFRLGLSPEGEAWLARPRQARLEGVLGWAPLGDRAQAQAHERLSFVGIYDDPDVPFQALTPTVSDWLRAVFAGLRGTAAYAALARSAAHGANPFLHDAERDAALAGRWAAWRTRPQELYLRFLERYAGRLASIGALAFAAGPKGNVFVTPTPIGDWLFRRAESWSLPAPAPQSLVVGADFSVTLLSPDDEARLEIAAFAEPAGAGFRITRESVQRAAQGGLSAAEMLGTLAARGKHAVPANVAHEIETWAGSRKTVRVGEAVLIEGDDPVVLAEIKSAFPNEFIALSPLALRYVGKGTPAALAKRLARKGFFT